MTFDFDALLDAVAWEHTSLGCRQGWPRSLETLLALLKRSKRPQYLVWGSDRRFFYNEAFLPVAGMKHPRAFGMPMAEVWPEVWGEIEPLVAASIEEGASHHFEDMPFVLRRHGYDELTYFSFSYTPVQDDDASIAGLMCVLAERTREVAAQAKWRSDLDRMQNLFKQAPGFMCVSQGPSHVYQFANDAYERLVGHTRDELLGRPTADVLPEIVEQGFLELLDQVHDTGESFVGRAMPVRLARKPGLAEQDVVYVDFVYQPIHNADGSVWGVFTQGSDVTDRVHAEQSLQRANAHKDRFLAMLGHELRNPIAPIHTAAEVLRRVVGSDPRAMQCVDIIARQSRQMSGLVEDLFDIGRIANGLLTLDVREVDLVGVAKVAIEQLRDKAMAHGHEVRTTFPPAPTLVQGDALRLTQIVSNLLSNAIRYTPRGGTIDVTVTRVGRDARVEVADTGEGIAPELLPDLFVPFVQAKRSADRVNGGLGIGLPLVKALVDAHGGRIAVDSEGRGKGSRFTVELNAVA